MSSLLTRVFLLKQFKNVSNQRRNFTFKKERISNIIISTLNTLWRYSNYE